MLWYGDAVVDGSSSQHELAKWLSAYAQFTLAKRASIRHSAAHTPGYIPITFESLIAEAIEEWQVVKNHKFYTAGDKTANVAQDYSKGDKDRSKDSSGKVGKGSKDLCDIHTSWTKKHVNAKCWKQHPEVAPEGYADKSDKKDKDDDKAKKDKKKSR